MNSTTHGAPANSIEALTLESLDQSLEGLEMLRRLSLQCGQSIASDRDQGLLVFSQFANALRMFFVFENDVISLFGIQREWIRDAKGDLQSVETRMTETMARMTELADRQDWLALGELLSVEFPLVIDRFEDLLPALRNRIENDYVVAKA